MPNYDVEVTVRFMYEVEADSIAEAEEQGWNWEDYAMFGEVYDIDATEQYHYPEDGNDFDVEEDEDE
jgi:hypothetical protein